MNISQSQDGTGKRKFVIIIYDTCITRRPNLSDYYFIGFNKRNALVAFCKI